MYMNNVKVLVDRGLSQHDFYEFCCNLIEKEVKAKTIKRIKKMYLNNVKVLY
jgi:hypothetical protein